MKPTHTIEWDAMIPLAGKPVLFAEFALECAHCEGGQGPYVQATKISMNTGRNRITGLMENKISLEVPPDHLSEDIIIKTIKEKGLSQGFDLLFAFMVSQALQKDEALLDHLT